MIESFKMRYGSKKKMLNYLWFLLLFYDLWIEGGFFVEFCIWFDFGCNGNLLFFYFVKVYFFLFF